MFHINRRSFLRRATGTAGLLAVAPTMPGFLARSAAAAAAHGGPGAVDRRVLVILQLTGGNDGLNTVVPFRDDRYHRARPTLRIDPGDALRLNDDLGLHPALSGLHRLHESGDLGVLMNVGYPNPDRSHFRSMDIWHACTSEIPKYGSQPIDTSTGWLGRLADAAGKPIAVNVDGQAPPLALHGRSIVPPSIESLDVLNLPGGTDAVRSLVAAGRGAGASDDLMYVQRVAVAACDHAAAVERVAASDVGGAGGDGGTPWPNTPLAGRLRTVSRLIDAGFDARIYYTTLSGFDTHARQDLSHAALLRELGDAVAAFQGDMTRRGLADRVMLMTFSEFGRRVAENGSRGTDHGAAAPMFVVGGGVKAGLHGGMPDLGDTKNGDVPHAVDFRGVYGTMIKDWLGLDPSGVVPGGMRMSNLLRNG
ncbi:MAG: DUF1501 domain-containing protein [Phycisphaerales bacterium]